MEIELQIGNEVGTAIIRIVEEPSLSGGFGFYIFYGESAKKFAVLRAEVIDILETARKLLLAPEFNEMGNTVDGTRCELVIEEEGLRRSFGWSLGNCRNADLQEELARRVETLARRYSRGYFSLGSGPSYVTDSRPGK